MSTRWTHTELDGTVVVIDDRSLADAQTEAVERLRAAYDRELARGMPWGGKVLQVDEASIGRITATAAAVANNVPLPAGFAWRMLDNSGLTMDRAGFLAMATAAFAHVNTLRARMWAAIERARAAATREDADKVAF
jgi:hypothetical protein